MKVPNTKAFEYWYGMVAFASVIMMFVAEHAHFKLFFGWVALAFAAVSGAYFFKSPRIFRKSSAGKLPAYVSWLFWPFLLSAQLYNAWARRHDKTPPVQEIMPGLYLARRLLPSDIDSLEKQNITAVLDVTSEFNALQWSASESELTYLNVPVLDHQSPKRHDIIKAINWINRHRNKDQSVVVHCALGRGRSVLIVAAYMLALDRNKAVREVLEEISATRQTAKLNMKQLRTLEEVSKDESFRLHPSAWVIANPVSGAGKWQKHQSEICRQLELFYSLTVVTTTPETDADSLAREACEAGASMLIAAGGDGTVNGVASMAIEYDIPMAIIPMGTANALCHTLLGINSKVSPVDSACEAIIAGHRKQIDVGMCNGELFTLLLGIGFETRMIELAGREDKNTSGQLAYISGFFRAVRENTPLMLTVRLDKEQEREINITSLVIANAAPISTLLAQGGGEPDATDGKLDVTWLEASEKSQQQVVNVLDLLMSSLKEPGNPDIVHKRCNRVLVSAEEPIQFALDGELRSADALDIQVQSKALSIITLA